VSHRPKAESDALPVVPASREETRDAEHELRLGLGDRWVVVKGRVVHCRIIGVDQERVTYQSGLEFIDTPDHVASVIQDFISAVKRRRQAG
jgi:hypothetical protein